MQRDLARNVDRHFEAVVVAYQQPLFAYAYRMSGCRQDAEEVVQDVFVRAYRALKTYEPDRIRALALQAWLYRICINQVRNRHRRARVATADVDLDTLPASGEAHDSTAQRVERSENQREMQTLVSNLPPKYRSAILLRYVNELSYPEIASALEQPEGTVKSNVHRGMALLRDAIANQPGETQ